MTNTKVKIKSYDDFKEQLLNIEKECVHIVLSFYKFCWQQEGGDFNHFKKLILEELQPFGLKPTVTKDMVLIFKYKREAEAVIYIKPYGIDLLIYRKKLWCRV